jgi:hypothetical protein
MRIGASVLQQVADFAFGTILRGTTPAQQLAHLATPAGLIDVALLIVLTAIPIVVNRRSSRAMPTATDVHLVGGSPGSDRENETAVEAECDMFSDHGSTISTI